MERAKEKFRKRSRRHKRVRAKIIGKAKRPRLSVFRSNRDIYAQLINDESGMTIASATSKESKAKTPTDQAKEVGVSLAKKAKGKKITKVVFDRGGFLYTGRVKALADGAREGGLTF